MQAGLPWPWLTVVTAGSSGLSYSDQAGVWMGYYTLGIAVPPQCGREAMFPCQGVG